MNKKGFTLIELLVVIAILGILTGFVTVNVLRVFDRQKGKVSKQEQKIIEKAVGQVMNILEDCDESLDGELLSNLKNTGYLSNDDCNAVASKLNSEDLDMTLGQLKSTGYLSGGNLNNYSPSNIIGIKKENGEWKISIESLNEGLAHTSNDSINSIIDNSNNLTDEEKTNHYAEYSSTPKTTPAKKISGVNESTISTAPDDYGTSYYYRGNVQNNYLNFANICWRIVRYQGDSSIKLILEDQDQTCESSDGNWYISEVNFGYESITTITGRTIQIANFLNPTSPKQSFATKLEKFQTERLGDYLDYLVAGRWCYADKANTMPKGTGDNISDKNYYYNNNIEFYYDSYIRLQKTFEPSYKCNGSIINIFSDNTPMYVGALTADEIAFAGGKLGMANKNENYYLVNGTIKKWWGLSPYVFDGYNYDYAVSVSENGILNWDSVTHSYNSIRPVVVLKNTVKLTGDGTKNNPYVIN